MFGVADFVWCWHYFRSSNTRVAPVQILTAAKVPGPVKGGVVLGGARFCEICVWGVSRMSYSNDVSRKGASPVLLYL